MYRTHRRKSPTRRVAAVLHPQAHDSARLAEPHRGGGYRGFIMGNLFGASLVLTLVFLFVGVLWILLPFAVFGTKPLIEKAMKEAQAANAQLKQLVDQQRVLVEQQKLLIGALGKKGEGA